MTSTPQPRGDNSELGDSVHPAENTRLVSAALGPGRVTSGKVRLVVPTPLNVSNIRNHRSPVERAIRLAVVELRYCALLWMLGFMLVLVKNADDGALPWAVAFLPLWLGNVRAIALCCRIVGRAGSCYDRIMSGTDYVRMVRAPTYRTTDPSLLEFAIPEDLVHLVNRGTVGALVAVPTFLLLMWTETMLCMHLSGGRGRKRAGGLWAAMAPLLFIEAVMVAQWALIKSNSWRGGLVMGLCFLSTVSLTHTWATHERAGAGASGMANAGGWWSGCIPLWLLSLVFLELIVSVVRKHCTGVYRLRPSQLVACGLYLLACAFSASAEVLLAARATLPWGDNVTTGLWLPLAGLGVGITCGGGALMIVIEEHAIWLIATLGFGDPLPLSKTEDGGWEPAGEPQGYDLALGPLARGHSAAASRGGGLNINASGVEPPGATPVGRGGEFEASGYGESKGPSDDTQDTSAYADLYDKSQHGGP